MCDCVAQTDRYLASRNSRLVTRHIYNVKMDTQGERLVILTEKIDPTRHGRAVSMFATYCPFCGEKLVIKKKGVRVS